jgi:hypothetical protein
MYKNMIDFFMLILYLETNNLKLLVLGVFTLILWDFSRVILSEKKHQFYLILLQSVCLISFPSLIAFRLLLWY